MVLAGLGVGIMAPPIPRSLFAAESPAFSLRAESGTLQLGSGGPATAIWQLAPPNQVLRVRRGSALTVSLANGLPIPIALSWRGPAGSPGIEPLLSQPVLIPGMTATITLPTQQAGFGFCDIRMLGDAAAAASRLLPVIVDETEAISVDRDEVFLIEDWRPTTDGTTLAPGLAAKDATAVYTVNGRNLPDIRVRSGERIRLRFINGCQRAVVAVKLSEFEVRVMAIDGQPAEPFSARNGTLVLAPGARTDAFIEIPSRPGGPPAPVLLHDGTSARPIARLVLSDEPARRAKPLPPAPPLPSNGLPEKLDLKSALRVEIALDGPDWVRPARFAASSAPAFQVKTGRTVVLALTNRAPTATVFHLHGHHARLLDRLDDGWKPYWLDTMALEPGQTQRVAFAAQTPGRFLIESTATDWAAPRLLRWYEVR